MLALAVLTSLPAPLAALRLAATPPSMRLPATPVMSASADCCRALQNGEAPEELRELLSKASGRRSFFADYLSGDEWTCADATAPPAGLTDSIESMGDFTPDVADALLMQLVSGGVAEQARTKARATVLINALWDELPELRQSCAALREAVASQQGAPMPPRPSEAGGWDGNFEYRKDTWAGVFAFATYDEAQLARVEEALASLGSGGP